MWTNRVECPSRRGRQTGRGRSMEGTWRIALGEHVATGQNIFFDDDFELSSLITPEEGTEDFDTAVAWARLAVQVRCGQGSKGATSFTD